MKPRAKAARPRPRADRAGPVAASSEKLHKVLARAGLGSRREIEGWISQGRVSVDGRPAALGDRVQGRELVRVDGRVVRVPEGQAELRVLLYHKPAGEVCTRRGPGGAADRFRPPSPLSGFALGGGRPSRPQYLGAPALHQ